MTVGNIYINKNSKQVNKIYILINIHTPSWIFLEDIDGFRYNISTDKLFNNYTLIHKLETNEESVTQDFNTNYKTIIRNLKLTKLLN